MTRKVTGILIAIFILSVAQIGFSGDAKIIEFGKQLFNDPTFASSTNENSCNSCHPEGKGIDAIEGGDYTEMINRCIVGALKGQPLESDSEKMLAVQAYLQSLVQQ